MNIKNKLTFLSLIVIFLTTISFAHSQQLQIKKVSMTMKNGSVTQGFIFIDYVRDRTLDINGFLNYYMNNPNHTTKFYFYPTYYTLHDNGYFGGFSFCKEERQEIEAETVKKMTALPGSYDGREYTFVAVLSKSVVELMQNPLISTDHLQDSKKPGISFNALNYDPSINKEKLHQILFKYLKNYIYWTDRHNQDFDDKALKRKMGWEKILFYPPMEID